MEQQCVQNLMIHENFSLTIFISMYRHVEIGGCVKCTENIYLAYSQNRKLGSSTNNRVLY